MEPIWLRVIDEWRAQPSTPPKVGPSLPFLFGAVQEHVDRVVSDEDCVRKKFFALLGAISDYEYDGKYFAIRRCQDVSGHFIISPEDAMDSSGGLQFFTALTDDEESKELVWLESRAAILSANYSFLNGKFSSYSDSDLELIRRAKGLTAGSENWIENFGEER